MPRQQTLQAAIDWSYNLLSDEERAVLRRLSVFMGGWSLEAAEGVCGDEWENGIMGELEGRSGAPTQRRGLAEGACGCASQLQAGRQVACPQCRV